MANSEAQQLLDPRGEMLEPEFELAHRASMDDLKKGPILFYDNTKLGFCNYSEVFVAIKEHFKSIGINNFVDFRETVRGKTTEDLNNYAKMLADSGAVGAVVALGDMGTTPASTVVTIALERLGIPSVYITASPGAELAEAVAYYRAGKLCLCPIDIYQGSTKEEVRDEIVKQMDCVVESLTLEASQIHKRADIDFALDRKGISKDGIIDARVSSGASDLEEIMDLWDEHHLGDGLPIIPPTKERLAKMLEYCPHEQEAVLAEEIGPTGKNIVVRDVAIAAVMAGCKPEYMPILIAAFKAMGNPKYNFLQSVTTSHPGGNLVLVSGPLAKELGVHGGAGCMGPGFRANATIGRAVNLVIINVCRSVPGVCDLDCLASPAEFTYCFAEAPALTPWATINEERFDKDTTSVCVLKAEPPHDVIDFLSQTGGDLLDTFIDCCTTLGSNNAYIPGNVFLVLTPDHAKLLNRDGYDKDRIRQEVCSRTNNPSPMVRGRGLVPVRPEGFEKMHPMPATRSPKDVEVIVAGNRGGHSAVILPWALHSEAIFEAVLLADGSVPKSIEDFKL